MKVYVINTETNEVVYQNDKEIIFGEAAHDYKNGKRLNTLK